jgi:hypothetical protein
VDPPAPVDPPAAPVDPPVLVTGMSDPVPCKVVTLDPSKGTVSDPPEAVIAPSLAKLLLEEVVNLSKEEMLAPLIEMFTDAAPPVFTATMTTSEGPLYAERDTPDAGLSVASTR